LHPSSVLPSIQEVSIASPNQLSLRDAQRICNAYIEQYPETGYSLDNLKQIEAKTVTKTSNGVTIKGKVTYDGWYFNGHVVEFEAKVKVDAYDNIVVNFNYNREAVFGGWTQNTKWKVVSVD
jgi:hypothetical protein